MSDHYDTMQVCRKWGHKVTNNYDSRPKHRQNYCERCGGHTIFKCRYCDTKIRGQYYIEGVVSGGRPHVPLNCHFCGAEYPWKKRALIRKWLVASVSPIKYVIDSVAGIFKK